MAASPVSIEVDLQIQKTFIIDKDHGTYLDFAKSDQY